MRTPDHLPAGRGLSRLARRSDDLGLLPGEQPLADLAQGDREGLLLHPGLDQGPDVLQQALAELGVIRVDLPGPLRRHDHEAVLAVDDLKQVVDRRVDDSFYGGSRCHRVPSGSGLQSAPRRALSCWARIKPISWSQASWTDVFTSVISNSISAASSLRASDSRRSISSGDSVPRPSSRLTSSSQEGGARNTSSASGTAARTWRAPFTSISRSTGSPWSSRRLTGDRWVPYQLP